MGPVIVERLADVSDFSRVAISARLPVAARMQSLIGSAHAVVNVLSKDDRTRIWNCIARYEVVPALFVPSPI